MAEIDYDGGAWGPRVPWRATLARMMNWAGGATSIVLAVGVTVWGYQLVKRDVTGVPVIQALEGPARVAPDDPGGEMAPHQGLAVNRVVAEGQAAPPADQLALAPAPAALTDEDMPRPALRPEPELGATPATEEAARLPDVPVTVPGVVRSPRPAARPEGDLAVRLALASATAALTPTAPEEVDAVRIAPGTPLVQLGTYPSRDLARLDWDRLSDRFESFLYGKTRVVLAAEASSGQMFRLRASGFSDIDAARRMCEALKADGAECIPLVAR
ncbi:sporulation related protein [Rhodovulum imhoffii]|uniref:Sporulation related protein n=1 Tax=Rhodovulum imhoffii TaxID=365340 RepID=A0A2T5BVR0_9RHOB|nr:SPOR domain-containing protein [Rhodovulum imhoffii]MBK5932791.1 hypothetical protein [Rhodovulum imhoffii]PTN03640.1 sporulation related protein [Rhodovulum imhoffii]